VAGVLTALGFDGLGDKVFRDLVITAVVEPTFHRTRDGIEAHLTIAFTPLAISRTVQNRTGLPARKVTEQWYRVHILRLIASVNFPWLPSTKHAQSSSEAAARTPARAENDQLV
jgi:hypothetical protein